MGGGNPCRMDVVNAPIFSEEKYRNIAGAFNASHNANIHWAEKVLNYGHFTSSAMGKIYPLLAEKSYTLSHTNKDIKGEVELLIKKIQNLQNNHGEYPAVTP